MSYIIKTTDPFVSIKLTEKGREMLSQGLLNFTSWAIGDSEINYDREAIVDANPTDVTLSATTRILRPLDRQPNIKTYITQSGVVTPFQPVNASNLSVIKAVVNNEATERGFFDHVGTGFTTFSSTTYVNNTETINNSVLTGGTILPLTMASSLVSGDYILIKLGNDTFGNAVSYGNTDALPNLWYKIQSATTGVIVVDRNLPNLSGEAATSQVLVYKGGEIYESMFTGTTTSYWDSGTLSFNSSINVTCHDVPVWNMNNVWCENLAGITGLTTTNYYEDFTKFGSYPFLGQKNPYLEYLCESTASTLNFNCNGPGFSYPDDVTKSISIIHYTNNTISSLYGEFFYIDTTNDKVVRIHMPDLMYHRRGYATGSGTTMGMSFVSSGSVKTIGTSDIQYMDLIEDPTMISSATTAQAIGKVFPQLKIVVIDDDEIVSAISYKTNRNWTLPALAANVVSPSGGTSTGVLDIDETMYLTYILENQSGSGLTTTLPCQEYIKITNNSSSKKDVAFRISETDLLPYMRKVEAAGYDGLGFYATNFKLMYQKVTDPESRPDPEAWKIYDFTTTGLTTNVGETIDPKALENQNPTASGFILDTIIESASTTFDLISILNMAPNSDPSLLQFGDERFFYGNIETYIGATIYKTIFSIIVNADEFVETTNPTRSKDLSTNPPNIKVSEVGIYDSANNLVCIGKLSIPVALVAGNTITLELSMDF
jgi:hypothetical protein